MTTTRNTTNKAPAVLSSLGVSRDITFSDMFCGAGGSSIGAKRAGATASLALNHWAMAIEVHNANHPEAQHDCTDVSAADPRRYWATDILLASPECTNHSLSKGVKKVPQMDLFGNNKIDPSAERSRATMWDVVRFAEILKYKAIIVENVVDAGHWVLFQTWLAAMHKLGYEHESVYFNSMHAHPVPQSRDRMYVVFWLRGNKAPNLKFEPVAWCPHCEKNVAAIQHWKKQEHWGRYKKQYVYICPHCAQYNRMMIVTPYYYCAANAIDWSLDCPRIGDRKKPLEEKTLKRIQIGLDKYAGKSFLGDMIHTARDAGQSMVYPMHHAMRTIIGQQAQGMVLPPSMLVDTAFSNGDRTTELTSALSTQTTRQTMGLVATPFLMSVNHSTDRTRSVDGTFPTIMTEGNPALVVPYYGTGQADTTDEPLSTVTGVQRHGLVTSPFLAKLYGQSTVESLEDPIGTQLGSVHHALVAPPPFLLGYYTRGENKAAVSGMDEAIPTQSAQPRHYLVAPTTKPAIEDCGFRMIKSHEIRVAMNFPEDYNMLKNTQRDVIKMYGQAVTPAVTDMLMQRVMESLR